MNEADLQALAQLLDGFGLACSLVDANGQAQVFSARHVVLATGRDGLGGPWVPELARQLPGEYWAHSADGLQDEWFVGKRVAVIGGGASAAGDAGFHCQYLSINVCPPMRLVT